MDRWCVQFFPALAAIGRKDIALAVLEKTDYPSFGFMRYNTLEPATSNLWELLDAPYQGSGMNSRNHHMWGRSQATWSATSLGWTKTITVLGTQTFE